MIGGYNNHTFVTYMNYNGATDLMAVVGYTYDQDLCSGISPICSFVVVHCGSDLALKWSKTFSQDPSKHQSLQCSFSQDGSHLGVLAFQNMSLLMLNSTDGTLIASTQFYDVIVETTITQSNIQVENSGSVYLQAAIQNSTTSSKSFIIMKMTQNETFLDIEWQKYLNNIASDIDLGSVGIRFCEEDGTLYSATSRYAQRSWSTILAALDGRSLGSQIWAYQYDSIYSKWIAQKTFDSNNSALATVDYDCINFFELQNGQISSQKKLMTMTFSDISDMQILSPTEVRLIKSSVGSPLMIVLFDISNLTMMYKPIFISQSSHIYSSKFLNSQEDTFYSLLPSVSYLNVADSISKINFDSNQNFILSNQQNASYNIFSANLGSTVSSSGMSQIDFNMTSVTDLFLEQAMIERNEQSVNLSNLNSNALKDFKNVIKVNLAMNKYNLSYTLQWQYLCDASISYTLDDFVVELKHKNGSFLQSSQFDCYYNELPKQFECVIKLSTINQKFELTQRNDTLKFRVRRSNSLRGDSQPMSQQIGYVISVPDAPMYPLVKYSGGATTFTLSFPPLVTPKNGYLNVISYEIYMKKSSESNFNLVSNSTVVESLSLYLQFRTITNLVPNELYEFKFRARNSLGVGEYSTVLIVSTYLPPIFTLQPPQTYLDRNDIVIDWSTNQTGLSFNVYFSKYPLNAYGNFPANYFTLPQLCDGSDAAVIYLTLCRFSMQSFQQNSPVLFNSGDSIYVTVISCNSGGCSNPSPNNNQTLIFQSAPTYAPILYSGSHNNLTHTHLSWYDYNPYFNIKVDYCIYIRRKLIDWQKYVNSTEGSTLLLNQDINIVPFETREFMVQAFTIFGESPNSTAVMIRFGEPEKPIAPPQSGNKTNGSQIHIFWNEMSKEQAGFTTISSFEIYMNQGGNDTNFAMILNSTYEKVSIQSFKVSIVDDSSNISAQIGDYCKTNSDCNQVQGQCCSMIESYQAIKRFACLEIQSSVNNTNATTCLQNGTDFTTYCENEQMTCIRPNPVGAQCGTIADMTQVKQSIPDLTCIQDIPYNNFEYIINSTVAPWLTAGKKYAFKYQARNEYGVGPFSELAFIQTISGPQVVSSIKFQQTESEIILYWKDSFIDNGYPITSYKILIRNYYLNYNTLLPYCDGTNATVIDQQKCEIPISLLTQHPYYFQYGTAINVQIQAANEISSTNNATFSDPLPYFKTKPKTPQLKFQIGEQTSYSELEIKFPIYNASEDLSYENLTLYEVKYGVLELTQGFEPLINISEPNFNNYSYILKNPSINVTYMIRHRLWNSLGASDWSNTTYLRAGSTPALKTSVWTSNIGANVSIQLSNSFESTYPIIDYDVQVMDAYQYFQNINMSTPANRSLSQLVIPMNVLLVYPFYLQIGDHVVVRARARNIIGWSSFTYPSFSEAIVMSKPQTRVKNLKLGPKTNAQNIEIVWPSIDTFPDNGGAPVDYKVFYAKALLQEPFQLLTYSTGGQPSCSTKDYVNITSGEQYKFMVRPYNQFGEGLDSYVLYGSTKEDSSTSSGIAMTIAALISGVAGLCA